VKCSSTRERTTKTVTKASVKVEHTQHANFSVCERETELMFIVGMRDTTRTTAVNGCQKKKAETEEMRIHIEERKSREMKVEGEQSTSYRGGGVLSMEKKTHVASSAFIIAVKVDKYQRHGTCNLPGDAQKSVCLEKIACTSSCPRSRFLPERNMYAKTALVCCG
jgi:hypothetical protein